MEIRHLRLVRAIVEDGSLAKAIDTLHLTPSALSHQLKEAEQQLGAQLFYRINKKLVLTPVGEKVLQAAHAILGELDRVQAEIKELLGGQTGQLRLSTECYTSYHWLPGLLKNFRQEYPHVEIVLNIESAQQPFERALLSGQVDAVITSNPVDDPNLEYVELFQDELVAAVPAGHPWAGRPYVTAEDFRDENLIVYSLPLSSVTVYQQVLAPAGVLPRKVLPVPFTEAAMELTKAGMGVKVIAAWAVRPYLATGKLRAVRITATGLHKKEYVARLKNKEYPLFFDCFINSLKREMRFENVLV